MQFLTINIRTQCEFSTVHYRMSKIFAFSKHVISDGRRKRCFPTVRGPLIGVAMGSRPFAFSPSAEKNNNFVIIIIVILCSNLKLKILF